MQNWPMGKRSDPIALHPVSRVGGVGGGGSIIRSVTAGTDSMYCVARNGAASSCK